VKGQTVLVTGATSGIGFYTARGLAARGARVLVTGRDPGRGLRALDDLRRTGHQEVEFLDADHSTVGGNQRLARRVAERLHRLDVLVNNVGGLFADRRETADGYEATLAVNAVGPFALTQALLPLLGAAGRSRVVNVVSSAHALWRGDPFDDVPRGAPRHVGLEAHARAKLLALLWTLAFARRPEGRGIAVNATNPGMAWTPGTRALTREAVPRWRYVWPLVRLVQRTASPERAARSPIHLASSPDTAGLSGEYFESGGRPAKPSPAARDPRNQDRAWRLLSDLVEHAPTALERSVSALHSPSVIGGGGSSEEVVP
jgi:NAD(P)-dependent dehydrogenase (short-subunit alcohol dehydrogenase family)